MKTFIGIKTSFRALHCWPHASTIAGKEVRFLEDKHRHTFHVVVETEVFHDNRDKEFFVFQDQVDSVIKLLYGKNQENGLVFDLGSLSCEQIALQILDQLQALHRSLGDTEIKVSEDNEVWARLVYKREDD